MKRGLSGYIPIRNGDALDYCWREAATALLEVCDEVILCDSDSDDGTTEQMKIAATQWFNRAAIVRYLNYPWPDPVGQPRMLITWLNWIRQHCEYDMQITCDADEVLCPKSYPAIRDAVRYQKACWFKRLNFWIDHKHLAPEGMVVGDMVARLGPTEWEMCSDEPRPEGDPRIRVEAAHDPRLRFFHYGFLRKPSAFFAKSKVMQKALHNSYDPRLQEAEDTGKSWFETTPLPRPLVAYTANDHPECARAWLRERGYEQ